MPVNLNHPQMAINPYPYYKQLLEDVGNIYYCPENCTYFVAGLFEIQSILKMP
jgi:hypothetical protein